MVASDQAVNTEGVIALAQDEAREAFDRTARHVAGVSGEDFLRRWDADEYESLRKADPVLYGRLRRVAELRAFAR